MAEVKKPTPPPPSNKTILVYKGWEETAEIREQDLALWEKAGFAKDKPKLQMTLHEQIELKRRLGIVPQ